MRLQCLPHQYGNEAQKKLYIQRLVTCELLGCIGITEPDAGSDVGAIRTRAVREGDGYKLNGAKTWITYAQVADLGIIYAYTEPAVRYKGLSAFIVDLNSSGITTVPTADKLGWHACPTGEIVLEDVSGFVLRPENPVLETGATETALALLTVPQQIPDGLIRGTFPEFAVQSGDQFKATIGCLSLAEACNVMFQLNYRIGDGGIQNLASWTETYNGQIQSVNIDLTPLAGKSVKFILTVLANGQPTDDQALWVLPRIMR